MDFEPKNMRDVVLILGALRAGALRELESLQEFLEEVVHLAQSLVELNVLLDAGVAALQPLAHESPSAAQSVTTVRDKSAALTFVANQVLGTSLALRNYVARWLIKRPRTGFEDDPN